MADAALYGILPGTTSNADPSSAWPLAGDTGVVSGTGTGQHGVSPTFGGNGMGGISGGVQAVWGWLNTPFKQPLAPFDVFLFVGVVLVAIILWNLILYHIRIAAEAI